MNRHDDGPAMSIETMKKIMSATPEELKAINDFADQIEKKELIEAEERRARKEKEHKKAEQDRINSEISRFPKRYAHATFENYQIYNDSTAALKQERVISSLRSGNSLVMFGKNGTGKTHLAYAFLRENILAGKRCKYILAPDLFDEIKSTYTKGSEENSKELIEKYARFDCLIIDELDKSFGTPSEFIGLYRIINARYDDMRPTIVMTNADDDTVISIVGRSCYERLIEHPGTAVYMDWKSYRARGSK